MFLYTLSVHHRTAHERTNKDKQICQSIYFVLKIFVCEWWLCFICVMIIIIFFESTLSKGRKRYKKKVKENGEKGARAGGKEIRRDEWRGVVTSSLEAQSYGQKRQKEGKGGKRGRRQTGGRRPVLISTLRDQVRDSLNC